MEMFRRYRRIGALLYFLAFFGSVGGHWLLAQSYAWATMAIEYSKKSTVAQGLKETFDGEHPCGLCHEIRREKEKDSSSQTSAARVELTFATFPPPDSDDSNLDAPDPAALRLRIPDPELLHSVEKTPPTPPPRNSRA